MVVLSAFANKPNTASSQPRRPGVPAFVDACVPIDHDKFQQLLAIELDEVADHPELARALGDTSVTLTCVHGQVELALIDPRAPSAITRRIDLRPVDQSARTRLVALAVAELVLARLNEPRATKPASKPEPQPVAPARPEPAKAEPQAEPEIESRAPPQIAPRVPPTTSLQLGAAAEALAFSSSFKLIPSLTLSLIAPLSAAWSLKLAAQLGRAHLDGTLDTGQVRWPASVRLTLSSLFLALLYTLPLDAFDVALGLGARGGIAFLRGEPTDAPVIPDSAAAPWLGPLVTLALSYRASRHVRIAASVECGFVALRARAIGPNGVVVMELRDVWGEASLGLYWAF